MRYRKRAYCCRFLSLPTQGDRHLSLPRSLFYPCLNRPQRHLLPTAILLERGRRTQSNSPLPLLISSRREETSRRNRKKGFCLWIDAKGRRRDKSSPIERVHLTFCKLRQCRCQRHVSIRRSSTERNRAENRATVTFQTRAPIRGTA